LAETPPGLLQPDDEALRAEGFVRYETPSPFVNFVGGCWVRLGAGEGAGQAGADVALRVLPELCNTHGTLHGGMLLVLADQVLAMTSKLLTRRTGMTMHVDADLLASAPEGALVRGRARILRQTKSTAFVEGHLHHGEEMILRASGVVRLLGEAA
jgi:uncharacterized protein (TIGR00369 family)